MNQKAETAKNFRDRQWKYAYKTSSLSEDGALVDILHDFYIPVLKRAVQYDRVAGYFTSSSLAAASQGYSAFTAGGGKVRLIVGAEMHPADVEAVLQGETSRLERHLASQLEGKWPEDVTRGVELLAWMVSEGYLDIRVAFRVHGQSREPLPPDSTKDGYVHEKWALFKDALGNRLLASGSLNESKTALTLNAENLTIDADWWEGPSADRIADHQKDFEALWEDRHPHFRVFTLPEAVQRKLVRIGERVSVPREIDGTPREVPPKPTPEEWVAFKALQLAPRMPGGVWVGMETAPINPWPHQEVVARRLIENWPSSFMLCDEVGLGKTIEAGLALRSLLLSGIVRRVLLATPAGLAKQWLREMAYRFYLPFNHGVASPVKKHERIWPDEERLASQNLFEPDLDILSTGLLHREERVQELKDSESFDVVLLDEAHYARRKNPSTDDSKKASPDYGKLYKVFEKEFTKKAKAFWFATATPIQLDWIEAYDLFRLMGRVGAFGDSPTLTAAYYEALRKILHSQRLKKCEWVLLKRAVRRVKEEDPWYWEYLEDGMLRGHARMVIARWLEDDRPPHVADYDYIRRLLFAVAPLSRVMLRHTRDLLKLYKEKGLLRENLAEREILPVPRVVFTKQEKGVYEDLQDYCQELARHIEDATPDSERRASLGFYLSFLRQRCSSSFFALRESLRRRRKKVERTLGMHGIDVTNGEFDEEEQESERDYLENVLENRAPEDLEWERDRLTAMLDHLSKISGIPSKAKKLLEVLEKRRKSGRIEQTVLFTRYLDTLNDLLRILQRQDPHMRVGVYSGKYCAYYDEASEKLVRADREGVKRQFLRGEIDVLLCTDAAAEGLNLQTADFLVNYDLPWNPMKVEQRVGRIDRIGQKHRRIYILNLCMLDSVEEVIYGRLLNRLSGAQVVMGNIPFSLLPFEQEDFNDYAEGKVSEEQLYQKAQEIMERRKKQIETLEMPTGELFEYYQELSNRQGGKHLPVTLEGIWKLLSESPYLQKLGCGIVSGTAGKVLKLKGIPGVRDGTCLTVDRDLFEKGLPDLGEPLHFATYLEPVFENVVQAVLEAAGQPAAVRQLTYEGHRPIQALAVATTKGERLITCLDDLEGIELVAEPNAKEQARGLEKQLAKFAEEVEKDIASYDMGVHERIMRINREAQRDERWLELFLAWVYLESLSIREVQEDDLFWSVLPGLEANLAGKDTVAVIDVPVWQIREKVKEPFFELQLPELGGKHTISIPAILCQAALDTACRQAEVLGKDYKKNELTVRYVKERLQRLVEK